MSDEVFQGLPVWHCFPGSVSERAGVRRGDVVIIANGVRVDSVDAYLEARSRDAEALELTLLRGHSLVEVRLDLREGAASDSSRPQASTR